jgi:NAD(P)-dependent dehydrogenase (short-subunit alcohol dehydrogenase family)
MRMTCSDVSGRSSAGYDEAPPGMRDLRQQRVGAGDPGGHDRLGMTKTVQLAISRGVAESVAGTGVTVNAVLPGPTKSEIMLNWMKATATAEGITQDEAEQKFLEAMRPTSLLRRFTTADEVANIVVYLCSEQASGTTGAALRVDGGVLRQIA